MADTEKVVPVETPIADGAAPVVIAPETSELETPPVSTAENSTVENLAGAALAQSAEVKGAVENLTVEVDETIEAVEEFQEWQTKTSQILLSLGETQIQQSKILEGLATTQAGMVEMLTQIVNHATPPKESKSENAAVLPAVENPATSTENKPGEPEAPAIKPAPSKGRRWM